MSGYAMIMHNRKPALHGGAAFGVAWKELMPSLKNAWNNEAYNEDKRINRKLYEKTAMELAAADTSEPLPPMQLRSVLQEMRSLLNRMMYIISRAKSLADAGQPYDLNELDAMWNELVAKVNPLVIGPVNVGMNDADTNALHKTIKDSLEGPLLDLQAESVAKRLTPKPPQLFSSEVNRNILKQVQSSYYRPVPYSSSARTSVALAPAGQPAYIRPRGSNIELIEPVPRQVPVPQQLGEQFMDQPEPEEIMGQEPVQFMNEPAEEGEQSQRQDMITAIIRELYNQHILPYIRRYNMPREAEEILYQAGDDIERTFKRRANQMSLDELANLANDVVIKGDWGKDPVEEIMIDELRRVYENLEDRFNYVVPRGESVERVERGQAAAVERKSETEITDLLDSMLTKLEQEGIKQSQIDKANTLMRKFVQNWRKSQEGRRRAFNEAQAQKRLNEIVQMVDAMRKHSPRGAKVVQNTMQEIGKRAQSISPTTPRPGATAIQFNPQTGRNQLTVSPSAPSSAETWKEMSPISDKSSPVLERANLTSPKSLQKQVQAKQGRLAQAAETFKTGLRFFTGLNLIENNPNPMFVSPLKSNAKPAEKPAAPRVSARIKAPPKTFSPTEEAQKPQLQTQLEKQKEADKARTQKQLDRKNEEWTDNRDNIAFLRKDLEAAKKEQRPFQRIENELSATILKQVRLEAEVQELREKLRTFGRGRYAQIDIPYTTKGKQEKGNGRYRQIDVPHTTKGKGRWTDYNGPDPVAVMRSLNGAGAYRDTPMGQTSRQTRPVRDYDDLNYNDETNDTQELGGIANKSEMLETENRMVHMDPDWKGLPKRLNMPYKKARRGNTLPNDKLY